MGTKEKNLINQLLKQTPTGVMIESKNNNLYLLHNHHKHLRPERDSIRILVGIGKLEKQFNYYSNEL